VSGEQSMCMSLLIWDIHEDTPEKNSLHKNLLEITVANNDVRN